MNLKDKFIKEAKKKISSYIPTKEIVNNTINKKSNDSLGIESIPFNNCSALPVTNA